MPGTEALWMLSLSFSAAAALTGLTLLACRWLGVPADRVHGVQRVHRHWAPRLGGIPIFLSLVAGSWLWTAMPDRDQALLLWICALPALLAGLAEDLWNRVGPRARLLATFASAWLAWFLLDGRLSHVDLAGFDWLLHEVWIFAFLFTAFAVGGVAHSVNLIDGFHGLSAFYCAICFAALFLVGGAVDDGLVQGLSLLFGGALLGFLVWNYPFGRVFLGDGGAYLLGFALAELSVLLVARHPGEVSPWFCFLLMAYPIWDTLFSSYRREVKRGLSWTSPDALHLHHLIYRRLVRPFRKPPVRDRVMPNAMTAPYVWVLGLMCAVPAVLFHASTPILGGFTALFIVTYGWLYRRIAQLRAPHLLRLRAAAATAAIPAEDRLAAK